MWVLIVTSASDEASRPRLKNLPRNLLHFSSLLFCTPTSPGNIDVLKGMQIKELNLGGCRNLEGGRMKLGWSGQDQ